MSYLLRTFLKLSTVLMLFACAVQKGGVIERPEWAGAPVWDSTGLSVSGYAVSDYSASSLDEAMLAEESALKTTRKLLAQELAKTYVAYLAAKKETLAEDQAAAQIERQLGNIQVSRKHYDEQRRVYFIQLYLPTHRVAEILSATFGVQVQVGENGQLK